MFKYIIISTYLLFNISLFGARAYEGELNPKRIKCSADSDISFDTLRQYIQAMDQDNFTQLERDTFIRQFKRKLEVFLEQGGSVERMDATECGAGLLHYAIQSSKIEIVKLLVAKGAVVNRVCEHPSSCTWARLLNIVFRKFQWNSQLIGYEMVDALLSYDMEVTAYLLEKGVAVDRGLLTNVCRSLSPHSLYYLQILLDAGVPIGYDQSEREFDIFKEELKDFRGFVRAFCPDYLPTPAYKISEKIRLIEKERAIRTATDPRESHKALIKIIDDTCGLKEKGLAVLVADYAKSMRNVHLERELESRV